MSEVKEGLIEILEELHPEVDFESETALVDDGILDSFDIVTLVAEISDNFDVELSAVHIVPDNFNTVNAMIALIEKIMEEE